jgi:hypothetical protein
MFRLIVHVQFRAVVAVQARNGQSPHAVLSHVGEVHRRPGVFRRAPLIVNGRAAGVMMIWLRQWWRPSETLPTNHAGNLVIARLYAFIGSAFQEL